MSAAIPTIEKCMTASPHAIGREQPLIKAHAIMKKYAIRHLPVLSGGELIGLLSDRDLALVEALEDVDPSEVTVEDAMSTSVYAVAPDTPLDQVLMTMADRKYGCAVVMRAGQVVGVFTTVDVCRAFAESLHGGLAG